MKYKNTLKKGCVRYIVFKEKGLWHAVALEFNIVETGDDPDEVLFLLFEAIQGYVESAQKIKARPNIFNQTPDPEYQKIWDAVLDQKVRESFGSLKKIYTWGEKPLLV